MPGSDVANQANVGVFSPWAVSTRLGCVRMDDQRVAYVPPFIKVIVWDVYQPCFTTHALEPSFRAYVGTPSLSWAKKGPPSCVVYHGVKVPMTGRHHLAYRLRARQMNVLERCRASTAPTRVSLHRNSPYQLVEP
eukprot:873899-Pyramimonas_sp.AAC.1